MPHRSKAALLLLACLPLAAACGDGDEPKALALGPGDVVAGVQERERSPRADGHVVNAVVAGANDLAVRLFREAVGAPSTNEVVGPYSVTTALLLTMAGTAGDTHDAFAGLLGVEGLDPSAVHPAANALDLILEGRATEGLGLSTANKVFAQAGIELGDDFLDVAVGSYGAPVAAVDFADVEGTADEVNAWVAEQTDGHIARLTDGYSAETAVVLANAMHLQAIWGVPFVRGQQPGDFTRADGSTVEVEQMRHDQYLPLLMEPGLVAVELPYVGGNLAMVVIQPDDLAAFEAGLTATRLADIIGGVEESGIHLTMPIWSTTTNLELLDPLHRLGLPTTYDFGPMLPDAGPGYSIDSISHVARIEVDETGTTASAATDVAIAGSHGPTVTIDRPFFYAIHDRGSGTLLFLGHVVDPTVADPS